MVVPAWPSECICRRVVCRRSVVEETVGMGDSGDSRGLASVEVIHACLVERLNAALSGPEMFGARFSYVC